MASRVQGLGEALAAEHGFLGVPAETFEQAGREQLVLLLEEGLAPEHSVLELGCGCLRVAYWLVRLLEPEGYCGIEPARERVRLGRDALFDEALLAFKRPRFDHNADFDGSVFGRRFDFFLARSIWTHASKSQIEKSLDSFVRDATEEGVFLASYLPARSPEEDYDGEAWVGTSHESDERGVVRHSLAWLRSRCAERELVLEEIDRPKDCDGQHWLRVRRRAAEPGGRSRRRRGPRRRARSWWRRWTRRSRRRA